MENFIFYLLKSGIWIMLFGLIYQLFLRKETFFKFNRFFLLAGLPASFALALCQYRYPVNVNLQLAISPENTVEQTVTQSGGDGNWPVIFVTIYIAIVLILLGYHLFGLSKISRLVWKARFKSHTKPPIIETPGLQSPFSFFGYVFMDHASQISEIEKNLILEHETAHVEQHHWIDLFLSQTVCALQWFNPFAWLYRNAIRQNHEFLADQSVIRKGYSQAVYHAALINYTLKAPVFALTNTFAYHKFKRIIMMKKNVSKPAKKFAVLLLIPALAVFLWAFAKPEYQYSITAPHSEPEVTIVEDTAVIAPYKEPKNVIGSSKAAKLTPYDALVSGKMQTFAGQAIKIGGISAKNPPLYILDDNEIPSIDDINPEEIHSISILKNKSTTELYGEKGKNGVIIIVSKNRAGESSVKRDISTTSVRPDSAHTTKPDIEISNRMDSVYIAKSNTVISKPILVIVDGKEFIASSDSALNRLNPADIESISVLKDKTAISVYGEKGKNGVIIVQTKSKGR